jgi:hypothetical protein
LVPVVFVTAYTDADTVERIHDKDPDAPVLPDQNSLARPRPTKWRDLPGHSHTSTLITPKKRFHAVWL